MSSADSLGHSISSQPPVLIFDLDGTVLSVNSFRNWVRYLLFGHFGELNTAARLGLSLKTGLVMTQRKLLRHNHVTVKGKLQRLWRQAVAQDPVTLALDWLVNDLHGQVRPNLQNILLLVAAAQMDAVLATAAAEEYAVPLGQKLGFKHILATPALDSAKKDSKQNLGTVKRDRTLALLKAQGWGNRPRIFFTDHEEDLPLIKVSDKIIWFGNEKSLKIVQREAPEKLIVPAHEMDARELLGQMLLSSAA